MVYRMQDALKVGQEAIRLDPQNADHLVNLSLVFTDVDDREHAVACLLRALGLRPDHADGHLALGQNLLAMGDFPSRLAGIRVAQPDRGRQRDPAEDDVGGLERHAYPARPPAHGGRPRLRRYHPVRALHSDDRGPLPGVDPGMQRGNGTAAGDHPRREAGTCHRWTDVPGHAAHCRLSSVPGLLHTTLDTDPGKGALPVRRSGPGCRMARTAGCHGCRTGVRRIGLAWTGRPTHPNDRRRSMPLARLAPLAERRSCQFRLAAEAACRRRIEASLAQFPGMTDISAELTDFGETAAVIANLDLVITVDTAMGHLAGALGKPVWIMLPKASDWRWLLERSDSPWYPTARLFRQQTPGDWDPVHRGGRGGAGRGTARQRRGHCRRLKPA